LAPQEIPSVLALEIKVSWQASKPQDLPRLIREMAAENPTWGEERIANKLKLKPTIRVSPRTVGKYLRKDSPVRTPDPKQRRLTFVHNHSKVMVACDFFVVITATFRTLYVFVVIEIGSRKILHHDVTAHPTAEWTMQQFREALPGDLPYRFVIHDRDRIFAADADKSLTNLGVRVLRTPVRAQNRTRSASHSAAAFVANVSTS